MYLSRAGGTNVMTTNTKFFDETWHVCVFMCQVHLSYKKYHKCMDRAFCEEIGEYHDVEAVVFTASVATTTTMVDLLR